MSRHLLILDGSKAAESAIPAAIDAAKAFGASLELLHVLEATAPSPQGAVDSVAWRMQRAEAIAYLDAWRKRVEGAGIAADTHVREGRVAEQTLDVVRKAGIDLLVLSPHGAGEGSCARLGSSAQRVIADGGVSILLVPSASAATPAPPRYRRVFVPLDASRRAECSLPVAAAIARAHGASLLLAYVAPVPEQPDSMPETPEDVELRERVVARNRARGEAYLEATRSRLGAADLEVATRVLVAADVGRAIRRSIHDEQADLVVASAHGGGCRGTGEFARYGRVARDLLAEGSVPLWILQDLPAATETARSSAVGPVFASPRPEAVGLATA